MFFRFFFFFVDPLHDKFIINNNFLFFKCLFVSILTFMTTRNVNLLFHEFFMLLMTTAEKNIFFLLIEKNKNPITFFLIDHFFLTVQFVNHFSSLPSMKCIVFKNVDKFFCRQIFTLFFFLFSLFEI